MNLKFFLIRRSRCFIFLGCLVLFACTNSTLSEPALLADKTFYLKQQSDRQYPPEDVMRLMENQLDKKKTKQHNFNELKLLDTVFYQFTLKNGLIVDVLSRDDSPHISITAIVNAGKDQLSVKDELLSSLVLKLLKQGTQKYAKLNFQQMASLLGEPIRYWQTSHYSVISVNLLPQDLELALDLLAQQLAYIQPDKNSYKKVTEQQLIENKLAHSSGSYLAKLLFYQNNYPEAHIYHQQQSNSNGIKNITKSELLDFYEKYYKPAQTRLIISGDFDTALIQNKVFEYFSDWTNGLESQFNANVHASLSNISLFSKSKPLQFDFIERKGAQQIDLLYGVVTVPRRSSDWLSLHILAELLGGGPSSRLFADLREKQGLAYFISARQLSGRYQSPFFIKTSVAPDKLIKMISGINNHIEHLCRNEVNKYELAQIKRQFSGQILFKLQSNQQLVSNKIYQLDNDLNNDYLHQLAIELQQINAQQLLMVANKYLCGQHNFIAVGEYSMVDKTIQEKLKDYDFTRHHLPLH
ncbi:MAG: insulinase family protein [gamma proteobacterium symbiont of Lucinoma myriamae]|nr:insulinase family protein [gamma proteobacterium symbiont of Lucinoma myriamae]MCU7817655.1 insulinase family protein [gamma proteobacterium symbiont of Lucinoma myriamae]MCU7832681.1 insulinase family protein [gamma proteobacterium symbiont of Lucinoma myriamae]